MSGMEKLEGEFFSRRSSVFFSEERGFDFNIKLLKNLWLCLAAKCLHRKKLMILNSYEYLKLWKQALIPTHEHDISVLFSPPPTVPAFTHLSVNYLFLLCKIMRYHTVPYRQYLSTFIKDTAIPLISEN